jgi:hypothetical protein
MAGAIIVCRVGFGLNDNAGAAIPNKLDPDEFAGHSNHITLKKIGFEKWHGYSRT